MKILAVDIGVGTQDILLYDSDDTIENSFKMVMPSPTRIIAGKIRNHHNDIFIKGSTMGGGPINKAIKNHLDRGYKVIMTESAAKTVRDDLDRVKKLGIEIIPDNEKHPEISSVELKDVDLDAIEAAFAKFDVEMDFDELGVAVQDHGYKSGLGDRNFRFMKIKEKLNEPRRPEEFAFHGDVPEYFTRMDAVLKSLEGYKPTLMDSKFASVCGATCDDYVKGLESYIIMDIGNGHTLAASCEGGKIIGVFEHHTRALTTTKLQNLVKKLQEGTITHEEVHDDGGHGAWVTGSMTKCECIVATGPLRELLKQTDFNVHNAAPAGDVMMTGPAGLIKSIITK